MKKALLFLMITYIGIRLIQKLERTLDASDHRVPVPEVLETLKDDEWGRVQEMGTIAYFYVVPPTPPYPAQPTFEQRPVPYGITYRRLVQVATATDLQAALKNAQPGDFIYLADGIYQGNFEAGVSGTADARITLYGSRKAILEGSAVTSGYGFHLSADYWTVAGFTVRKVSKGIVTDGANHTILRGLEIYQIGDEGIHLRSFSSDNSVEQNWIHDVGLINAKFGEAIYVGSAVSNWGRYSSNEPDASDRNRVIGNLLGPNVSAESVDIKEGTTGGVISHNTFISTDTIVVENWVAVKGNNYEVSSNVGLHNSNSRFQTPVVIHEVASGWGQANTIYDNSAYSTPGVVYEPFRAIFKKTGAVSIVLPERSLPYRLSELLVRFPGSFEQSTSTSILVKEHIVVAHGAHLMITSDDGPVIRLLSSAERFVSIVGYRSKITITGTRDQLVEFQSWDSSSNTPDSQLADGRAYIYLSGGHMDVDYAVFSDLGFYEGTVSGVAWKGFGQGAIKEVSRGNVTNSHFIRNYFGAYTFEASKMRWYGNTFANNISYGFDPHDFSNEFLFEGNQAYGNGSHGIIFSRGCERNIIRNNDSYNNQGDGIMLDDGKVLPDIKDPRYHAVPSNYNIVEANRVWNNRDGIVLEGGIGNIVRYNEISGSGRYGVRFKDAVTATLVMNNRIRGSARYGIYVYNNSHGNVIIENQFVGGLRGVVIQNSDWNILSNNRVININGSAIDLRGDVTNSTIVNNVLSGRGPRVIKAFEGIGSALETLLKDNNLSSWKARPVIAEYGRYVALALWLIVILTPVGIKLIKAMRKLWFFPSPDLVWDRRR